MSTEVNSNADFIRQAEESQAGLISELWALLRYNKKWWLAPIVLALAAVSCLVFLGGTAAAPFIYALF